MAKNIVWLILDMYLIFYLLFWYRRTTNWSYVLMALILLSLLPLSVMRVLGIPVAPLIMGLGWWRYLIFGPQIVGICIVVVKFVSDSVQERP